MEAVSKIIETNSYKKAYKKLLKDHRNDVIADLNTIINKLTKFEITTQSHNHPLKNIKDAKELHIRGDILLIYRYVNDSLIIDLELLDLLNHKQLKNKNKQKQLNSNYINEAQQGQQLVSNGIYSVLNNKWIKEPVEQDIPEIDEEVFEEKFTEWEDRYFELINNSELNSDLIDDFLEDIYELRKQGLKEEGEFSIKNLIFKECRNLGYLDNLKDLKNEIRSKELSLEWLKEDFEPAIAEVIYQQSLQNDGGIFDIQTGVPLVLKNKFSVEYKSVDWNKKLKDVDKQEVINNLNQLQTQGLKDNAEAIGTWSSKDSDDSSVGLDKIFDNKDKAISFAKSMKQKAVGGFDSDGNYYQINIEK